MPDMWYYTCEGKQMEPVTAAELRQLAASGHLKPNDLVWTEGMPNWVAARATQHLFSAEGRTGDFNVDREDPTIETETVASDSPGTSSRRSYRGRDDEDDDDDRPRRRSRRPVEKRGMDTGLKVGLILGGSILGVASIALLAMLLFHEAPRPVRFKLAKPPGKLPPIVQGPLVKNLINKVPPPVYKGPLTVGPQGLVFNESLAPNDPVDTVRPAACKVFSIHMTADKTYTIFMSSNAPGFDSYLRLEDSRFVQLAEDDDSGGGNNALVTFRPNQTGDYRVIATVFAQSFGNFTLQINEN